MKRLFLTNYGGPNYVLTNDEVKRMLDSDNELIKIERLDVSFSRKQIKLIEPISQDEKRGTVYVGLNADKIPTKEYFFTLKSEEKFRPYVIMEYTIDSVKPYLSEFRLTGPQLLYSPKRNESVYLVPMEVWDTATESDFINMHDIIAGDEEWQRMNDEEEAFLKNYRNRFNNKNLAND